MAVIFGQGITMSDWTSFAQTVALNQLAMRDCFKIRLDLGRQWSGSADTIFDRAQLFSMLARLMHNRQVHCRNTGEKGWPILANRLDDICRLETRQEHHCSRGKN